MFNASSKDFGSEINNCKSEFYEDFQMLNFDPKQSNKSLQMILHMVQNILKVVVLMLTMLFGVGVVVLHVIIILKYNYQDL